MWILFWASVWFLHSNMAWIVLEIEKLFGLKYEKNIEELASFCHKTICITSKIICILARNCVCFDLIMELRVCTWL